MRRVHAGGGGGGGPAEYYRAYFSSGLSRAPRFAPVFNITPRSRMFYPPPPTITFSPPSRPPLPCFTSPPLPFPPPPRPSARRSSYEGRGIAPRNEFTILIWRAALAIYYLHGVGEKKKERGPARRRRVKGGQTTERGRGWELARGGGRGMRTEGGGGAVALEGGATIREGRKYIVSICERAAIKQ